ncbi:MAG TPA: hypothetical protein PKD72_08660, partial [Gemmatales bacterium]|nr:hypothetical protein [Gemmatales bacterium]
MPSVKSATAPAPLVPVAVAVGLGLGLERQLQLPALMLAGLLGLSVAAWLLAHRRCYPSSTVLLWLVAGCLAACWHSLSHAWPADAIGHLAPSDRTVMQVRGHISDDVQYHG